MGPEKKSYGQAPLPLGSAGLAQKVAFAGSHHQPRRAVHPSALAEDFAAAMLAVGMLPPRQILADGRVRMFSASDEGAAMNAWYVLSTSGRPHGAFGCKRLGVLLAWGPAGVLHCADDLRAQEVRNKQAQLKAFSDGLCRLAEKPDKPLSIRYAREILRVADRLHSLGASAGLPDPLEAKGEAT